MNYIFLQFCSICKMIRIEHSIFALPYAWAGACLAANGMPPFSSLIWLTLAMIAVRSFAMAFNRIADVKIDRKNPRTKNRELVTGAIGMRFAIIFTAIMAILFVICCGFINFICLCLSLPALFFAAAYSYIKRISFLCHFWLGATLGLAPLAGSIAVNAKIPGLAPILLSLAVIFWVAAFDIYYSFQDIHFDKTENLHSVPARLGKDKALAIAGFAHANTVIFLVLTGIAAHLGWLWYLFCLSIASLLYYEHALVNPDDLKNINMAFFTLNGIISPLALAGIILGIYF